MKKHRPSSVLVPFSFSSNILFLSLGVPEMASSSTSDPYSGEIVTKRPPPKTPFKFLVPLIYAPILPLIRIAFRRSPVLRDRLFTGVLAGGFLHGSYLVSELYDSESK